MNINDLLNLIEHSELLGATVKIHPNKLCYFKIKIKIIEDDIEYWKEI